MKYIILIFLIITGLLLVMSAAVCIIILPLNPYDIPIVLNDTIEYSDTVFELIGYDLGGLIIFIISNIIFSLLLGIYKNLNRRIRSESLKDTTTIQKPFILYLRSFSDEKSTRKKVRILSDQRTEEEMLIDVFSDIAPIYAIGDPADKKMPYGANRIYVDDTIWQATVETLACNAEIVILRLGQTNNFWWEVGMALSKVPVEKLVFVIPWSKTFNNVSTLYKILLEHGIDISQLNVSIEKKREGSISSILFFKDNHPICREIVIPRLTGLFLSYDNLLRNALTPFREKYGLKTVKKLPILKSRILFLVLLLSATIGCGGILFGNLLELKYQRPYEIVEECVKDSDFTFKYGSEKNGTNLTRAIIGFIRGKLLLSDQDFKRLLLIENEAMSQMSYGEAEVVNREPFNLFLIIKKYTPDHYQEYVEIAARATLLWAKYPVETANALTYYKNNTYNLPQWVQSFIDENSNESEEVFERLWTKEWMNHIDDADFAEVMKTIVAQAINPDNNINQ